MPAIRRYLVTQTREVEVTANDSADAIKIAEFAFTHGQHASEPSVIGGLEGVWGNTETYIRETEIVCKEKRVI